MKKLLLGIAATALMATGAIAADPVMAPQPVYNSTTFDWDGFYLGIGISGTTIPAISATAIQADIIAGFNATSGNILFGAEMWVGGTRSSVPSSSIATGATVRLGYLVSPEALIYTAGGLEHYLSSGNSYATVGGGVEFAVTNDLTLDLEYKYGNKITGASLVTHSMTASANWHF